VLPDERGLLPPQEAPRFVPVEADYPPGQYTAFPSRRKADLYALAAWILTLRRRAEQNDGDLRSVVTGASESFTASWPADLEGIRQRLHALSPEQVARLKEHIAGFPLYTDDGPVYHGDLPRIAADGRWMVRIPEGVN
jgi:hypothetical protein